MRVATQSTRGTRQPLQPSPGGSMISTVKSIPAPVGGWNARESIADMPETDAIMLENFWPTPADVMLRRGYTQHATGFIVDVQSLMPYQPGGTGAMFAAAGTAFYNVTAGGAVGAAVVSGLTNAIWESVNFTNADPTSYLCCFNGVDAPEYWDGSNWLAVTDVSSPIAITGVTTTSLKSPLVFKRRLWAIESGTLKAWYLPVDAVGGAASALDLSAIANLGGSLVALANWTVDGGEGVDDYWAAVTTEGQVVVYKGTDPDSAVSWTLQGVWNLGEPIGGSRCFLRFGGDVLYMSSAGLVPMSKALQTALTDERIAVSDKIESVMQYATLNYAAYQGWGLMFYPGAQMLMVNVPTSSSTIEQYVMNTVSKAWAKFTNLRAFCWAILDGVPYFGSSTFVGKFWQVESDNDGNIFGEVAQAPSYFGTRGRLKNWKMCRPIILANSTPGITVVLNTDFAEGLPIATATFNASVGGLWDTAVWDVDVWGGDLSVYRDWQTVSGHGIVGSFRMQIAARNIEVRWQSTDWVLEVGGVL